MPITHDADGFTLTGSETWASVVEYNNANSLTYITTVSANGLVYTLSKRLLATGSGTTLAIERMTIHQMQVTNSDNTEGCIQADDGAAILFVSCNLTLTKLRRHNAVSGFRMLEALTNGVGGTISLDRCSVLVNNQTATTQGIGSSAINGRYEVRISAFTNSLIRQRLPTDETIFYFTSGGNYQDSIFDCVGEIGSLAISPTFFNNTFRGLIAYTANVTPRTVEVRNISTLTPVGLFGSYTEVLGIHWVNSAINLATNPAIWDTSAGRQFSRSSSSKNFYTIDYRLSDASGVVVDAEVSFVGFDTYTSVSDSNGLVSFLILANEQDPSPLPTNDGGFEAYTIPVIDRSSYTRLIKSYGHLAISGSFTNNAQVGTQSNPSSLGLLQDTGVTETNTTTVGAYPGITNATGSITLSGTLTLNQVYDSRKLYWRNNSGVSVPTKNGGEANFGSANITINATANLPATTVKFTEFSTTGTITLGATGNYSATPFIAGSSSVITVTPGDITDLRTWTIPPGATVNRSGSGSAPVYVANTTGIIAGTGVTLQLAPPVITIAGFQPGSSITISQAGRTLDRLNDTSPPFTWAATGINIPSSVALTITKDGFEIYTQTIQVTQANQSITVAQIPAGATDTFNGPEFKFKSLMIADSGFKRILAAATGALVDDAANCRLAQFESASVKTSWNLLVAATVPTAPEITAWQGYLVSAGYSAISFANSTGEV